MGGPGGAGIRLRHPDDGLGPEGVRFWTKNKKITQRWPDGGAHGESAFIIPTMG